ESAPDHVRKALDYLDIATGSGHADDTENDPEHEQTPPQSPATRAIRTLRALRAQRDEEQRSSAPDGMVSSAAMLPETSTDGGPSNGHALPGELRSQFRNCLPYPCRILRRLII